MGRTVGEGFALLESPEDPPRVGHISTLDVSGNFHGIPESPTSPADSVPMYAPSTGPPVAKSF